MGPGPHRPPQLVPPTTSSSEPLHTAACSRLAPGLPVVESGTQRSVSPTWADPDAGSRPTPSASRTAIPCVQATRQVYRRQFSHDSHVLLTALAHCAQVVTTEATRTNEQVRHDVQAELKWYAGVEPNESGAAVKDGIVILRGWVDPCVKSWEAERAAVAGGDGAFGGQVLECVAHLSVERVGCFSAHGCAKSCAASAALQVHFDG